MNKSSMALVSFGSLIVSSQISVRELSGGEYLCHTNVSAFEQS